MTALCHFCDICVDHHCLGVASNARLRGNVQKRPKANWQKFSNLGRNSEIFAKFDNFVSQKYRSRNCRNFLSQKSRVGVQCGISQQDWGFLLPRVRVVFLPDSHPWPLISRWQATLQEFDWKWEELWKVAQDRTGGSLEKGNSVDLVSQNKASLNYAAAACLVRP